MKYSLTILFIFSSLIGFAQKQKDTKLCPDIYKNGFKEIQFDKFDSVVGRDTLSVTEVKYVCTYSVLYTHKVMFDKFGQWHKSVSSENAATPLLIWENIRLFDDSPKNYTVITSGEESWKYIYAGITVLDDSGKDILSEDSPERQKLIDYFKNLIRKNKERNDGFYEIYWTSFNPERWNEILEFRKKRN